MGDKVSWENYTCFGSVLELYANGAYRRCGGNSPMEFSITVSVVEISSRARNGEQCCVETGGDHTAKRAETRFDL